MENGVFETEIKLYRFLKNAFDATVADIPEDRIFERAPGGGHPPVWILGHLAICGELGEKLCGGDLTHPRWLVLFGPGSSDDITSGEYSVAEFAAAITDTYERFISLAVQADADHLQLPHGVELLDGSPVATIGDLVAHLLSTHFSFHLAQLSAWRRAAGHPHLF